MKLLRTLLIGLLAVAGIGRAHAYDIYSSMITLTNSLSNGGYVEVTLPFYDDDGLDEALAADWDSGIWVNDSKVVQLRALNKTNSAQSTGDSYWCDYSDFSRDKAVEVLLPNGMWSRVWGEDRATYKKSSSTTAYISFRIYPTPEVLATGSVKVNVKLHVDKINSDFYDVESTRYYSYSMPNMLNPTFMLAAGHPGYQTMSFSGKNRNDSYSFVDPTTGQSVNGTFDADNEVKTYDFAVNNNPREISITNRVNISSYQTLELVTKGTIPAYFMPSEFKAEQKPNCDVEVSWLVDADTYDRNYQNTDGNWEVQRAMSADFAGATTVYSGAIGTKLTYDKTFSFIDHTSDLNYNGTCYYRIRRTNNAWNWDDGGHMQCSLPVEMNHRYVADAEADIDGSTVTVSWQWDLGRVWSDNSKVYYVRHNLTTGLSSAATELTASQINAQSFSDNLPTLNEYYAYTIYVRPGNNVYETQTPLEVKSDVKLVSLEMGHVKSLTASKGYYNDCVDLRWTTDGKTVSYFTILARVNGSGKEFEQIASVEANGLSVNYRYSDTRALPGLIYDYVVRCNAKCGNDPVSEPGMDDIGFRRPTGEINGRVAFANGQAEENVTVTAQPSEEDESTRGKALAIGHGGRLTVGNDRLMADLTEFTFQAYVNPSSTSGKIAEQEGLFTLSIADNHLRFDVGDQTLISEQTVDLLTDPQTNYMHVTAVAAADSLQVYVDGSRIMGLPRVTANTFSPTGPLVMGDGLTCVIDEVRVWNRGLDEATIKRDYNRYIVGNETGLIAYYTFDLCTDDAFFDYSYHGLDYNENHGVMENATVETESVPAGRQLGYRGISNEDGTYAIRSIPFSGNGLSYLIVPQAGSHTFSPVKELRYISATSTVHTVNFTDNSSFMVSGYVTYEGGNVPSEGVQFEIDGVTCTKKGQTILTDANGYFEIEVPVGTHEVKAVKEGHIFANDGRITNLDGSDRNYQDIVTGIELTDQTLIKYIGRLAGGAEQAALPIGYGRSTNNLGEATSIRLRYQNDAYTLTGPDSERTETFPHYRDGVNEVVPENEVDYAGNEITIRPNIATGEFVAYVPPLKYAISVEAPGYERYVKQLGEEKDFSQYTTFKLDTYAYTDSIVENGVMTAVKREESVWYNLRQNFAVRVAPEIEVRQYRGSALKYFGEADTEISCKDSDPVTIALYDAETGQYTLGRPVFNRGVSYRLGAAVQETYTYRDLTGAVMAGHEPDKVASKNAVVEFTCGVNAPVRVEADSLGMAYHTFVIKETDITNPVATVSVKAKVGDEGSFFAWTGGDVLTNFIVTGSKRKGSAFVTAGPDQMITVLRDPPGSNSYSYIEEGSTLSRRNTVQNYATVSGDQGWVKKVGEKSVVVGAVVDVKLDTGGTLSESTRQGGTNTWNAKYTFTQAFQTSSDPVWVGAPADLYIGHSTNMTYGECDIIKIVSDDFYNYVKDSASSTQVFQSFDDLTADGCGYRVVKQAGFDAQLDFGTTFAYTQHYIENTLIPNIKKIRDGLLLQETEMDEAQALALAEQQKQPVYVSKVPATDPNFGVSVPEVLNQGKLMSEYQNYKIYFPQDHRAYTDSIHSLNESIRLWQERISLNERAKLEATLVDNYSFQGGGSRVSVSESYAYTHTYGYVWSASIAYGQNFVEEAAVSGKGAGVKLSLKVDDYNGGEQSNTVDQTAKKGFVLADNNANDYFTVDVLREQNDEMPVDQEGDIEMKMPNEGYKPAFVFRTKGGASSCPYEGQRVTKYYNPGTELDAATLQIEGPRITIDNPFVENVPTGEAAAVVLKLSNNSDADCTVKFKLKEIEKTNPDGLQMSIDGSSLNSGYTIVIPAGQTIAKTLLCRKANVLNYDNIGLKLASDYVGLGVQPEIEAKAYFSVHFTPGASAVNIANPAAGWTYNTNLPVRNIDGIDKHYMDIEMDGFDTGYDNFTCLRLQYKPSTGSDKDWVTLCTYYADEELYNEAVTSGKAAYLITAADNGKLNYQWFMDDQLDQNYDLRAIGVSTINNVEYTNASAVRSGIKDMYNPRLFGQPQPASGILGVDDEVRINFNEPIAEGYLTRNNFSVTGVRNGAVTDHSVSVTIQEPEQALANPFERNLADKDITFEMWIKPTALTEATWFDYGGANGLRFGITADNKLQIANGDWSRTGSVAIDANAGEWAHVALVYNANGRFDAYYNFEDKLSGADAPELPLFGQYRFGGSFEGNIHDARIWTRAIDALSLKANSLVKLSGRENGLMAYYPMSEGRGSTLADRAHGANLTLGGAQWTLPAGKAASLSGASYIKLDTSAAVADASMDFTAEMWFKGDASNVNATLLSNGDGSGSNDFCLGFEDGVLQYVNNGTAYRAEGDWLDNSWHHAAVAVSRTNGRGQICIDGSLAAYFPTENVGGMGGAVTTVGARLGNAAAEPVADRHFNGSVDEVRLWNVYRNEDMLSESCNVQLSGDETGLMAYYPFESYVEHQGTQELVFSLADAKTVADNGTAAADAVLVGAAEASTAACAPVKGRGEVSKLLFDYVVNSDAIIITLNEDLNRIENTIVTFGVDGVRDLNGNKTLNPITWSAYIDRNQLCWDTDRIDLSLDNNATATFEADVVNRSGRIINYRISNLPSWMEASATSGKVNPTERQTITFTVTDAAAVGNYTEYLYLTGDNEVVETLVVNVKVNGQKPDWTLNPAEFDYSMNMIGKLKIGANFSTDTADIVGVFNGGQCVGLANNTYVKSNDTYEVLLTLYGKISSSKRNLDFYAWDASTGETLLLTPSQDVKFTANTVVGSLDAPVTLTAEGSTVQYIPLEAGWNWISIAVDDAKLVDINQALGGYGWTVNDAIKSEAEAAVSYHNDGYWIGSLHSLSATTMYHIYAEQPLQIHFAGESMMGGSLTVKGAIDGQGRWTYLPYWPAGKQAVNEAMAGYEATAGDILKGQTKFAVYSETLGWVGNLTAMEPGKGYMLRRAGNDDVFLTYGATHGTLSLPAIEKEKETATAASCYSANMTVVAALKGVEANKGDLLLALVNGEVRGCAEVWEETAPLFFLTVAGDKTDIVDIVLERNGRAVATARDAMRYVPNNAHGTAETPYVVDFEETKSTKVYPTIVTDIINVDVAADTACQGLLEIFDISGNCLDRRQLALADGECHLEIDATAWPAGVYLIALDVDGKHETYKIIRK